MLTVDRGHRRFSHRSLLSLQANLRPGDPKTHFSGSVFSCATCSWLNDVSVEVFFSVFFSQIIWIQLTLGFLSLRYDTERRGPSLWGGGHGKDVIKNMNKTSWFWISLEHTNQISLWPFDSHNSKKRQVFKEQSFWLTKKTTCSYRLTNLWQFERFFLRKVTFSHETPTRFAPLDTGRPVWTPDSGGGHFRVSLPGHGCQWCAKNFLWLVGCLAPKKSLLIMYLDGFSINLYQFLSIYNIRYD